jgi:hypothetical protein
MEPGLNIRKAGMNIISRQNIAPGIHPLVYRWPAKPLQRPFLLRVALIAVSLIALALPARATVLGVTQCDDSHFTIQLQGFPNAAVVVQLLLSPSGEIILDTTYNFAAQTLVAVRPAGLAAGTYHANFYVNGVWFTQADLVSAVLGEEAAVAVAKTIFPAGALPAFGEIRMVRR